VLERNAMLPNESNFLTKTLENHWYRVFHRFGQAKSADGGSIFFLLPQLTKKIKLDLKMVNFGSKIIVLLPT
jgi:hypothetical protein